MQSFIVVLLLLCSCAQTRHSQRVGNEVVGLVPVTFIDRQMADHVRGVLESAGIPTIVTPSMAYSVSVPPEQKARAIELLRKDAEEHHYRLQP